MRGGPGTGYSVLMTMSQNAAVAITGKDGNWYKVLYDGTSGYISGDYVTRHDSASGLSYTGRVTADTLNIRSGPGTGYDSVGKLYTDEVIKIFYQVTVGETTWGCTKDGWISLDYVYIDGTTGDGAGTGTVSGSNVNIRSGPGTNYDVVGSYSQGDSVEIYAQFTINKTVWGCTNKGWVCMDYVEVG